MTEEIDWLLLNHEPRSLPRGLRNKLFPKTDSLSFPVLSENPALPPWLSQWPVTLASVLEQRPNHSLLPQEVTPPFLTASSYKHVYFANYSGVGSSWVNYFHLLERGTILSLLPPQPSEADSPCQPTVSPWQWCSFCGEGRKHQVFLHASRSPAASWPLLVVASKW